MDKDTYDSYSEEETVTEDQVNTKAIELGAITLKEKSVSIFSYCKCRNF